MRLESKKYYNQNQMSEYKKAQIKNHNMKLSKKRDEDEYHVCYEVMKKYLRVDDELICLGTRNNHEKNCFISFGNILKNVYSLDIAKESKADFVYDFNNLPNDWENKWNVAYTNCPDHCIDATKTFYEWLRIVKVGGLLMVGFSSVNIDENLNSYGCCTFDNGNLDKFFQQNDKFELLEVFEEQYRYYLVRKK